MPINTLDEKFAYELSDAYDAEHRFTEAMQQMLQQASDNKLKQLLQTHMGETEQQIQNLEQIFSLMGAQAKRVKCDGAAGIVSEAQKSMEEAAGNPAILDCIIAGAAARGEHYEIASYRGLVMGAEQMGQQEVLHLLHQNLQQEEQTAQLIEDQVPKLLQKAMSSS